MSYKYLLSFPVFLIMLFAYGTINNLNNSGESLKTIINNAEEMPLYNFSYLPFKDTIYVLGESYIEISLLKQTAILYRRNDSALTFKVSSGNINIKKGKDTPEGIFTVQYKSREAISKQFNNAKMLFWIGFNGNVGFHGLEGNSYYHTLGVRPSSHGCVRMRREDGEMLYKYVKKGTPVIVFKDTPARVLAFAKPNDYNPNSDYILNKKSHYLNKTMKSRMRNLYSGKAFNKNIGKLFLDGSSILYNGGFETGLASKLPTKQEPASNIQYCFSTNYDKMSLPELVIKRYSKGIKDTSKQMNNKD